MRLFEILLIASIFLVVWLTTFHPMQRLAWRRASMFVMVLAAGTQLVFEGSRWQLYPVYLLIFLLIANLIWRLPKLIVGVVGALAIVTAITSSLLLPIFSFEEPTGPYDIGTVTYHWVDNSRREVFSTDPKARREVMVQIWYPAEQVSTLSYEPYVEEANSLSAAQATLHGWPTFLLGHLKYIKSNARPALPVSGDKPDYPVLLFLEGITGYRQMNTFQVEHLASLGYIVVAIDQPFIAATVVLPYGRKIAGLTKEQMDPLIQQSITVLEPAPTLNGNKFDVGIIPYFAQDVVFVLNQLDALNSDDPKAILGERFDLNRIGIFGVSLGGIVVGEACRLDRRLRACLVMDAPMSAPVVRDGLWQPSMWITRDAQTMRDEGWSQFDIDQHQKTMGTTFHQSKGDGYFLEVSGMYHANLTDVPHFSPVLKWAGITGPIDATYAHSIINAYTVAFFDRYLAGPPATILDGASEQFPEVRLERR